MRALVITDKAGADLVRIARRIAKTISYDSALRWRRSIDSRIRDLALTAECWPEADEAEILSLGLRCRLVGRRPHVYRILFTIGRDSVIVHRVRHAAQDRIKPDEL